MRSVAHLAELCHHQLHLAGIRHLHLLTQEMFGADESVTGNVAQGYHLVGAQLFEEPAVVGRLVVGVLYLADVLVPRLTEVLLRGFEAYVVCLVGEKQIEVVDAQAIYLHKLFLFEMLQDMEHAEDAVEGVEGGVIHHSRTS